MFTALFTFVTTLGFLVALSALYAYPVMLLWNGCLVPAIEGVHTVSWLQMWGINIMISLMLGRLTTQRSKKSEDSDKA